MNPITVWGHWGGPNPWKVCIILKELQIPYDYQIVEFAETKQEPYIGINPNGRLPSIEDPNTGTRLWETGAIILYLIEQYDVEGKISYKDAPEKYDCLKWLMFQVSGGADSVNKTGWKRADQNPGQGPYFGQLAWFARFHKPSVPSAIERYANEMERIFGVLDKSLTNQQRLVVGDKCTFADLSFVTWSHVAKGLVQELGMSDIMVKFPHYVRWLEAMEARQPVRDCLEAIVAARAAHGLPP